MSAIRNAKIIFQEEEEDITVRVASMLHDADDDDSVFEDDMETDDNDLKSSPSTSASASTSRKRQLAKNSRSPPTSPTYVGSPNKRPRRLRPANAVTNSAPPKIHTAIASPALELLETKKKVQRNGLYHWVLWREALRGEKDRVITNPRRLFN